MHLGEHALTMSCVARRVRAWRQMPVFISHAGKMVSWYDRTFIAAAQQRFAELPRLTPEQVLRCVLLKGRSIEAQPMRDDD
jgi:hypothetical protein